MLRGMYMSYLLDDQPEFAARGKRLTYVESTQRMPFLSRCRKQSAKILNVPS
jgi:hypothetical protein